MTAPMTPKLDEARLRESEDLVRDMADAIEAHLLGSTGNFEIAVPYLDQHERALRTLLDALSAERERGDRAVGLLRRWRAVVAPSEALEDITDAFLATQKAEGAET